MGEKFKLHGSVQILEKLSENVIFQREGERRSMQKMRRELRYKNH